MFNPNWDVLFNQETLTALGLGLTITIQLALYSIIGSTVIGVLIAYGRVSKAHKLWWLRAALTIIVEFFRNVPIIVQLAFWYFAVFTIRPVQHLFGPIIDVYSIEFVAGACALIAYRSVYVSESIRSGLQSVPRGQYEAAMATGLGYWQTMFRVITPQAFRAALPSLINQYVGVTKNTSVVLVIGVHDLVFEAYRITSHTFEVFLILGATVAIFVILCLIISQCFNTLASRLDRRWGYVEKTVYNHWSVKNWLIEWTA